MITIKERIDDRTVIALGNTEKEFKCPHCGVLQICLSEETFFCTSCLEDVLNIGRLANSKAYRLCYYSGTIDDKG